jgi:hypothetical protein
VRGPAGYALRRRAHGKTWTVSATVREILNPEPFNVGPEGPVAPTRDGILAMGITAAAVLDGNQRASEWLRSAIWSRRRTASPTSEWMTRRSWSSVTTHASPTSPGSSARRATGTWSSWTRPAAWGDGLRRGPRPRSRRPSGSASRDPPAARYEDGPHLDRRHGAGPCTSRRGHRRPGLIMLVHDAPGVPRRVVGAASAANVFTRLTDMLTLSLESPALSSWLEDPDRLCFGSPSPSATAALGRGLAETVREEGAGRDCSA